MKYTRFIMAMVILIMSVSLFSEEYQDLTAVGKKNLRSANMHLGGGRFEKALPLYLEVVNENGNHIEALENLSGIYYDKKGDYYGASEYIDKASAAIDLELEAFEKMIEEKPQKEKKIRKKMEPLVEKKEHLALLKKGCWVNLFKSAKGKFDFANKFYTMNPETLDLTDATTVESINEMLMRIGPDTITDENQMTIEEITAKFDVIMDESISDYEKLYTYAPDSTNTIKMLAYAYNVKGNEDKEIEYFIKAAEADTSDELVRQKLGNIFFSKDDNENAVIWFEEAKIVNPENIDNYNNLGIVYSAMDNKEKALENYEEVVKLNPDDLNTIINISNISNGLGDVNKSIDYLKKAIELDPENVDFLQFLSYRLFNEKRYAETITYAEKWYNIDNTSKEAASLVYQSAKETGDEEIKTKFEKILTQ